MSKSIDLTGQKFGKLTVLGETDKRKHECIVWECRCDCGNLHYVRTDALTTGLIASCGCEHIKQAKNQAFNMHKKNHIFNTNIGNVIKNNVSKRNTSGYRGIAWHKASKKWQVRIQFQKKQYSLGYYDDFESAKITRKIAEEKIHGEFLKWYTKFKKGNGENEPT